MAEDTGSEEAAIVETATYGFLKKSSKLRTIPLAIRAHLSLKSKSFSDLPQNERHDVCKTCGLSFQVDGPEYRVLYRRKKRKLLEVRCKGCGSPTKPVELPQKTEDLEEKQRLVPVAVKSRTTVPMTPVVASPLASRTSSARKKDRANKLRKLASLEASVESPTGSLSSFLSSLRS